MNYNSERKNVLITGSKSQLAQCLFDIKDQYPDFDFDFTSSEELDISNTKEIEDYFDKVSYDIVINCAAYTNVELAEKESKKAFMVNAIGVKNIAEACKKNDATLIHISTDYVFDGKKETPYTEEDLPNPINEYGKSKLEGEKEILKILDKYFIIRTSWLYSKYGHNFFKTILRKSRTEKQLTITASETGTPTNAHDLAKFILEIVSSNSSDYGLYHYSNLGEATWHDFAEEILRASGKLSEIKLEKTDNYPTFAVRPKYGVLSKEKTIKVLKNTILHWKDSLRNLHSIN
ncbi:dTDP-4-dehydrorhamnose reductase [Aquimarina spongiae]|uniref:dTDP-4-dehydrorhamnose reductase n=1 Tax=Aquimarina spongiae TaxID=570521 RepID=A0A1M6FAK2_9FLAO|nr:dTDP-4-dehydrorhamnose reductase [Aquimarina spongiae]SHI94703.1 dTDP-4-dehydrorhamnose reductase [Aquimarina spongiae]